MANLKLSPHSLTHSLSDSTNYKEMLSHLKKGWKFCQVKLPQFSETVCETKNINVILLYTPKPCSRVCTCLVCKNIFLEHGFRCRLIFYVLYRCIELYTVRRGAVRRHPTVKPRCNSIDFSTQTSTPSIWQPRSSLAFEWSSASSLCNFWRRFNFGKSKADYEWLPCSATVKLTWKCSGFAWSLTFWKSNPNYLLKNRNHSKYLAPC